MQQKAIESGKITVNGKRVDVDCILQNGDYVTNFVHRFAFHSFDIAQVSKFFYPTNFGYTDSSRRIMNAI